jgi:hypothetical protein
VNVLANVDYMYFLDFVKGFREIAFKLQLLSSSTFKVRSLCRVRFSAFSACSFLRAEQHSITTTQSRKALNLKELRL